MFHPFQLFVVLNRLRHSLKSSRTLQCYLTRTFSFSTTQGILWLFRTLSQLIFRKQEWCKKFFPLLSVHVNKTHVTGMTKTNFLNSILKKKKNLSCKAYYNYIFLRGRSATMGQTGHSNSTSFSMDCSIPSWFPQVELFVLSVGHGDTWLHCSFFLLFHFWKGRKEEWFVHLDF